MQANISSWNASISMVEEVLYVAHQALESRNPLEKVQLEKGSTPIARFRTYMDRDADGRPFVMLQAVLHLDASLLDTPNNTWNKILETTTLSVPAVYLQ